MSRHPFDDRNEKDFAAITARISSALARIRNDGRQKATKANLAKISGVHRNTLYHRSRASSNDGDAENGWPFRELEEISRSRRTRSSKQRLSERERLEGEVDALSKRLEKSRYVASSWFHRAMELKKERDEASRQVGLLLRSYEEQKQEIERLRKNLVGRIKVINK